MAKTYDPQISIWVIKARKRELIADKVKANSERYSRLNEFDITPFLGQNGTVETSKSIRQPAGTFSITVPDKPYKGESLYALLEPMDLVEIRMSHTGLTDDKGQLPLVMRGFVSGRSRSESISDRKPQRVVRITGHDYGKILQIIQVMYFPNTPTGAAWLDTFKFFSSYMSGADVKTKSVKYFMADVVNLIINPYLADFSALQVPTIPYRNRVLNKMATDISVDASVSAYAPNQFEETSLYQVLKTIMDTPVFNEIFTQDSETEVTLILRPTPFKRVSTGQFIQGTADSKNVFDDDIISITASADDSNVANYFWITAAVYGMDTNRTLMQLTWMSDPKTLEAFDYVNSDRKIFGIRKMQYDHTLLPSEYQQTDNPKDDRIAENKNTLENWMANRRQLLADMSVDNAILESGTLELRGDETIKAGTYLQIYRSGERVGEVYAHTVSHKFAVQQSYTTTATYDRGTMYYERVKSEQSLYFKDVNGGGV